MVEFDGGGTVGSSLPMEVNSQCDRVVLRRFIARPRPRRTTLGFGICQMILGLAIIAVSFTAFALSTSNRVRNACPYWAGFSVLLTGGVGLIAWKQPSSLAISFFTFLSAVCVVLHLVATALSGLSGAELQSLAGCFKQQTTGICYCCNSLSRCIPKGDLNSDRLPFEGVQDCGMVTSTIKELMYAICVANIVACVVCIAATIIGCAYIVKRHTTRRMVLRRSLNGSMARDSFYTDIMPVDPVFTPPLVPPPPYSPPEYAEISNDPVIMESPEFMDDLSTPTPVIGPNELPPPYSILDFATGRTISVGCAVAQEYQVNPSEVQRRDSSRRYNNRQRPYSTGNAYIALLQNHNGEGIPQPPLRWDSHQVAVDLSQGNQQSTNNTVLIQSTGRRKNNKRPSSSGSPRQIRDPREILRYITTNGIIGGQTTCLNGTNANSEQTQTTHQVEVQTEAPPHRSTTTLVGMRERSASAESGNAHLSRVSTASQTSLEGNSEIVPPCVNMATNTELANRPYVEDIANANIQGATPRDNEPLSPMTLSRLQIGNIPCAIGSQFETPDIDNVFCDNNHIRVTLGKSPETHNNSSPRSRCIRTPNGTIYSPAFATPSDKSHSGSSERLTNCSTTTSRSSRGSTSSSGRRHRRHRSNGERRSRTSTSTCSSTPTDLSSQSSGGSFGRTRRQARPAPPSSSSSDSEQEIRIPPSRRMVSKMVNGTIQNVLHDDFYSSFSSHRRPPRNRKSSGSSTTNTPPRGRTRHRRPAPERNQTPDNKNVNVNSASTQPKDTNLSNNLSNVPPLIPPMNNHGDVIMRKHKRPDTLDLNLHKQWIPRQRRSLVLNVQRPLDLEDPWVRRDNWTKGVALPQTQIKNAKVTTDLTKNSGNINIDNKLLDAATSSFQNDNEGLYGNSNGPLHLGTADLYARTHNVLPSEKASVSAPVPRAPKYKVKPRPKSMVELTKNTASLVTKFLDQSHHTEMSPAIKDVLKDIQSVIDSDENHLAEILQSTSVIDKYVAEKTGDAPTKNCTMKVTQTDNKIISQTCGSDLDSWTGRNKLFSVISDSDTLQTPNQSGARPKGTNTLRREMVKNLQEAKETIL